MPEKGTERPPGMKALFGSDRGRLRQSLASEKPLVQVSVQAPEFKRLKRLKVRVVGGPDQTRINGGDTSIVKVESLESLRVPLSD
ncbi:hypothetical protein ACIBAC_42040 [Streptomyces sp. NPDC051362]|uniref:hypothetical protein n=1 Tax=Streptomyces sp. NPDC051362 TaxID=3365651 RepID=UPI00379B013D